MGLNRMTVGSVNGREQWRMTGGALQDAIRRTGLAGLTYPDLKYSVAATVEHFKLPFVCCVWLYVAASYEKPQ